MNTYIEITENTRKINAGRYPNLEAVYDAVGAFYDVDTTRYHESLESHVASVVDAPVSRVRVVGDADAVSFEGVWG